MSQKREIKRKLASLKARLTRITERINSDTITDANALVYSQSVDKIWDEMEVTYGELLQSADNTHVDTVTEEFSGQELQVLELRIKLQPPPRETDKPYSDSAVSTTEVRLPALDLPIFRGDITEWATFSDLFRAAVHNNCHLSNAQKLQYLKSALRGEASKILKNLPVTEANYQEAWDLLKYRYENKRHMANTLARSIVGLQDMKKRPIREVLDTFYEAERALSGIINKEEKWELLVANIISTCLDAETLQAWELSLPNTEIAPLKRFLEFLEVRARVAQTAESRSLHIRQETKTKIKCPECKQEHTLRNCPKFEKGSTEERRNIVIKHRLCFNCFSSQHAAHDCKASRCRKCQRNHHTTLHREEGKATSLAAWASHSGALLPTAMIYVNNKGATEKLRVLLDTGSQVNIMSEAVANRLKLRKMKSSTTATTISGNCRLPDEVRLSAFKGDWKKEIKCYTSPQLDVTLPSTKFQLEDTSFIKEAELADPQYNIPSKIDMILGVSTCCEILKGRIRRNPTNRLMAQETELGWVLGGEINQGTPKPTSFFCRVDQDLRRFWELEEVPKENVQTKEEEAAQEHYNEHTTRTPEGNYEVKYPFFEEPPPLGNSRDQAITRFLRLEKQLTNKRLMKDYNEVIQEYITLGHLSSISESDSKRPAYYLPHHAVLKDSTTTKLRVVFDASARTTRGTSLNDTMMNGPKIQEDLFHIILRFQIHPIAISADIEKMFRQIKIHPDHQNYQRIIWRSSPKSELQELKLTTLTFGMKSSPFLATKTLMRLATDEGDSRPLAKTVLLRDFYVDDLLTGTNSKETALQLCRELDNLLRAGGFTLRKWCSNEPSIVSTLCKDLQEENVIIGDDETVKTLGLQWTPKRDTFAFKVQMPPRQKHTKRTLLSDTSRIFDPLGWLAPLTINAKILFQDLWRIPLSWDEELPSETLMKWKSYREELILVQNIEIPRYLSHKRTEDLTLCGFCDASEKAYGAVIYLRAYQNGQFKTKLLVAKSKVAPLKPITIPRMELCAAVLLARLMKETLAALKLDIPTFLWTDSAVVLHWITEHPSRWKTFVAHRVVEIQELTEPSHWSHVATDENPADLISRGISAAELLKSSLWWNGPGFLALQILRKEPPATHIPEQKKFKVKVFSISQDREFIRNFSSLDKLLRIVALVVRFANKTRKLSNMNGPVRVSELRDALQRVIRTVQNNAFDKEMKALRAKKQISKKSPILSLTPFIDNQGILRVGGRLSNAPITFSQRHQILLPHNHHLTNLILSNIHRDNLHAGGQLMLTTLRQRFWIPKANQTIRQFLRKCTTCIRHKARISEQLMGQLPQQRVTPNRPFLQTGIDFCGPVTCKEMVGRNRKSHKAYVAVFVCMATKAIHLEAVPSLSTESFLSALTRFTSRRGLPSDIYSDNGKNFVGTNNHLKEVYELLRDEDAQSLISNRLASKGIQWHFIPPYSPHFGGLWEAGVKSIKFHLRRSLSNDTLTYEELSSVLCKVEACLNSRPLCPMTSDHEDFEALTPGHFLIGSPLNAVADGAVRAPSNLQSRYKLMMKLTNDVWNRWQKEYLSTLQAKSKWKQQLQPITEGDLVIIKDPNLPPQYWKLARVISTAKDKSGLTRVLKLRTPKGITSRSITQVVKLFSEKDKVKSAQ